MNNGFQPWPAFSLQTTVSPFKQPFFIGNPEIVEDENLFSKSTTNPLYLIHLILEKNQLINKDGLFDYDFYNAPHYRERVAEPQIQRVLTTENIIETSLAHYQNYIFSHPESYLIADRLDWLLETNSPLKNLLRLLIQPLMIKSKNFSLVEKNQIMEKINQSLPEIQKILISRFEKPGLDKLIIEKHFFKQKGINLSSFFLKSFKQSLQSLPLSRVQLKPLALSFSILWEEQAYFAVPIPKAATLYAIYKLKT